MARAQAQPIGPSFPCPSPADPLGQLICSNPELARDELAFVQAYDAAKQQYPDKSDNLRKASIEFTATVHSTCGVPSPGTRAQITPTPELVNCAANAFIAARKSLLGALNGAAAEEASRPLELHMQLQSDLRRLGYLPSDAAVDGVYGPATRQAINNWQHQTGRPETGFLGDADATALNGSYQQPVVPRPDPFAYRPAPQPFTHQVTPQPIMPRVQPQPFPSVVPPELQHPAPAVEVAPAKPSPPTGVVLDPAPEQTKPQPSNNGGSPAGLIVGLIVFGAIIYLFVPSKKKREASPGPPAPIEPMIRLPKRASPLPEVPKSRPKLRPKSSPKPAAKGPRPISIITPKANIRLWACPECGHTNEAQSCEMCEHPRPV